MERREVEKISKALADETRLMIFEAISTNDRITCTDIVAMRGVTPATVSHHLKILAEANLIESRREGQFVCNRVIPETIPAYTKALAEIAKGRNPPELRKSVNGNKRVRRPKATA